MDSGRDELDRMIDGALASYSDAEPLAGIEQRLVNRVHAVRNRRRWLAWGVGAAVTASVVVGMSWSGHKTIREKTPVAVARVRRQASPPKTAVISAPRARVRVKRAARPRALPKLEQFPTPTPLTAEERALVAFVRGNEEEARQVLAANEDRIQIEGIQIQRLWKEGSKENR